MEINCRIKINNKINVTYAGSNDYSHFFTSQELTVKENETQTTQAVKPMILKNIGQGVILI